MKEKRPDIFLAKKELMIIFTSHDDHET